MSTYKIGFLLYGTHCFYFADIGLIVAGKVQRKVSAQAWAVLTLEWSNTMVEGPKEIDMWLEGVAAAVDLTIPTSYQADVIAQLELNRTLIAPLLDFELPPADYLKSAR